ncbi:hypothetical protein Cni_G09130 [Canna indica]|uniref:Sieve element occlusion n=1 Tax=Canna indica TaxID=4628 RepID=A0AAQ3K233_9LILI|nr:hypothetical protein Cni_G09130 [Canna indica]
MSRASSPSTSTTMAAAAKSMRLIKGDRHLFSSSDDSMVVKQILATHSPDGREFDTRPLFHLAEDILQKATPTLLLTPQDRPELVEDKLDHSEAAGMLEVLASTIHRISCEITCKFSGGGEPHATTLALFNSLTNYSWDAKMVISLAAFAASYGEFWLIAQLHAVNPLAKSVALLKQLPGVLEHADVLQPRFEALNSLIHSILNVTMCIIRFKELPPEYVSHDTPEMETASKHIPIAVYWTIRSIVACASQIIALVSLGHEHLSSTTEVWELSSLAHKVNNIHGHLTKQLELCFKLIDEKKQIEAYLALVRLFETLHVDNREILRALIRSKDDLPLIDGSTKKRASVDALRKKTVMFFISDLDITQEELLVLVQIYIDDELDRNYEIVWLPMVDRLVAWEEEAFKRLASSMPWYSLCHPSFLERAAVKYIRDVWRFEKKPLLVVLDAQGKVVCPNALHMMWIWGSRAFPFTSNKELALWKEESWRFEFLVDEIDPMLLAWVREGRNVCLYGGENVDWIRKFTTLMRHVSQEARVPIEMVYVGKRNARERVKKITDVIDDEKLSGYLSSPVMIWFFWERLESMWHSMMQQGKTIEDDPILQEVITMLSFDGSEEGWAVIGQGSLEPIKAYGRKLIECLLQFETWMGNVEQEGFVPALANALLPFRTGEHCTRLILPGDTAMIAGQVICAECKRPMDKFVLYRCCNN